jgi:hypothetical protein
MGVRPPRPRSRRIVAGGALVLAALVAVGGSSACGTDPVGVDSCKRIEKVRCESAQACGISLDQPAHQGSSPEQNVAACTRYYDDQCLHGLVAPKDPGPSAVDACVNAIIAGDCAIVKTPESHPACQFLVPPNITAVADASADADADAATD